MEYTAEVNLFMPAFTIPFLAWAATIAEAPPWYYLNSRNLGAFRGARSGGPAAFIWHRHGDLVRHQISPRLFRVFRVCRSVATSCVPVSKVRS